MSAASGRWHAHQARLLIKACGGLEEAAGVCRLSVSHLSRCQDGLDATVLPVDVIADLEMYCGQAIYSSALVGLVKAANEGRDLAKMLTSACAASEGASDLQRAVRVALADDALDERERRAISGQLSRARADLDNVAACLARANDAGD